MTCSEIEELLPGYALDALSAEETAAVEEHLESCPWCPGLLREHTRVAAVLAQSAPLFQPADSVKRELMEALEAQDGSGQGTRRRRLPSARLVGTVAASVAVLLLAGVVALEVRLFRQMDQVRQENDELSAQVEEMSQDSEQLLATMTRLRRENQDLSIQVGRVSRDGAQVIEMLSSQVSGRDADAAALAAQTRLGDRQLDQVIQQQRLLSWMVASLDRTALHLRGGAAAPGAYGVLSASGRGDTGVLVALGLSPLPSDRVYQVWLWDERGAFSGGTLSVDDLGRGLLEVHSTTPIADLSRVAITTEPAEGSSWPTGPEVLSVWINP